MVEGQAHEIQSNDAKKELERRAALTPGQRFIQQGGATGFKRPKGPQNVLRTLPQDAGVRKSTPITTGVLDYFPLALMEVAKISKAGNDQHNPGQPLHWVRGKSSDHADCVTRHLIERGLTDSDGMRHSAKMAWRALALLQEELEAEAGFDPNADK